MSLCLGLDLAPRFGLEVSPALVAFGEMLMLPHAAMQTVIEDELDRNDALERLEPGDCPICRGTWRTTCPLCSPPDPGQAPAPHDTPDAGVEAASREPDTEILLRTLMLDTPGVDRVVAEYVVGNLDPHGFLDRSCAELAAELGTAVRTVAIVVEAVRRVGPPGVGASSVAECLLLQLDALGLDDDCTALAQMVIADHLPALARGNFSAIAASLGVSRSAVRDVLDLIRQKLRPYPAFDGNSAAATRYAVPDVVIVEDTGDSARFMVQLVEPAMVRLCVRPRPRGLRTGAGGSEAEAEARTFLTQLHGRWETLRRVAEYAVEHQHGYLTEGTRALAPLTRAEVAVALDLHESTVSRAIADKFVMLPDRTIVPLSRFFSTSGGLDAELRRLVESSDRPVSDQELADGLRQAGYPVARRTVAKHRARLGIPAAALR
jgi:RNA polymerase sigma-54 factor